MCKSGVQPHNNSRGSWMIYFLTIWWTLLYPPTPTPKMPPTGIMYRICRRESYLYGGVIFIHKVVLDELDGECTLAHASSSHHHQLILRHLCRCCSHHTHTTAGEKTGSTESCRLAVWWETHTHTHTHTTRFEQNNRHTQSFDKLFSATGLAWCSPQPVVQTKHTVITITAKWRETLVVCVCACVCVCVHVCVVGAEVETLKGECEKCAEGTQCSNPLALSVSSRVCMRGRAREAAREKKKGHDTGRLTLITKASHYWCRPLNPQWQKRQNQNYQIKKKS